MFSLENGPATTCQFLVTLEPNRIDVTGDDTFACQRGPVCDQKDDQERGNALFVIIVRQEHPRIEVDQETGKTIRT